MLVETGEVLFTMIMPKGSKATIARFGYLNKYILVGHDDGTISQWEVDSGEMVKKVKQHTAQIQDLQFSKEMDMFITASKDFSAKLFDADSLEVLKVYATERNVNGAAISPLRAHIILGGGQEAMSVTTTRANAGKFEVRLFHQVFEEEIGRIKGHFGPINTVAFHPSGKGYVSVNWANVKVCQWRRRWIHSFA
jgi:translation initiation factor 3 subunit I